jgi:hypothetical protein
MSAFEDELRRTMASHDDEAPRAGDLLRSLEQVSPRRRAAGWYGPLAVAAVVVAVVAGSFAGVRLLGHRAGPAASPRPAGRVAALACPARYAGEVPWVPAKPAGVDGRARLVPQRTPSSALMCAYAGSNMAKRQVGWVLSGRRSLTGNLAGLATQLSWKARSLHGQEIFCGGVGGPQTDYLIGLTYPGGGTMWVAVTDDACDAASNGEFTSARGIGPDVGRAFTSGRWPAQRPASCNGAMDIGRLGEDRVLVPAGATSLTICASGKGRTFTSGYQAVARALDRLPTRPSSGFCSSSPKSSAPMYQLLFSYPEGPLVSVYVSAGCHPEVGGLDLQSASASTVMPIIQQLLEAK